MPMPPTNDGLCEHASVLRAGETTVVPLQRNNDPCTAGNAPGPSNFFSLTIPPRSLAIVASPSSFRYGSRIYGFDSCADTRCRVEIEGGPITPFSGVVLVNEAATPQSKILALVLQDVGGAASFGMTIVPLAACESPTPLTVAAPAQTADFSRGGARARQCSEPLALYYSVTVPAASVARIALNGTPYGYGARVIDNCASINCELQTRPDQRELVVPNEGDQPRTYLLELVGSRDTTAQIAHVSNTPIPPPALTCQAAQTLALGASIRGNTAVATTAARCAPSDGAQLFYSVTLAANTRGRFNLRREGSANVRARLLEACNNTRCDVVAETVDDNAVSFVVDNFADEAVQRIISVSAAAAPGAFSISLTSTSALSRNRTCSTWLLLSAGSETTVDTSLGGGVPAGCETDEGRSLYYNVIVEGRSRVTVSLTRSGSTNMRLRHYESCELGRCAQSVATNSDAPVTLELTNPGPIMSGNIVSIGAVGSATTVGVGTLVIGPSRPM